MRGTLTTYICSSSRPSTSHTDTQNGVCTQPALVARTIQLNHTAIDLLTIRCHVETPLYKRWSNDHFDIGNGALDAFAVVRRRVIVPKFYRFVVAFGSAGGHNGFESAWK